MVNQITKAGFPYLAEISLDHLRDGVGHIRVGFYEPLVCYAKVAIFAVASAHFEVADFEQLYAFIAAYFELDFGRTGSWTNNDVIWIAAVNLVVLEVAQINNYRKQHANYSIDAVPDGIDAHRYCDCNEDSLAVILGSFVDVVSGEYSAKQGANTLPILLELFSTKHEKYPSLKI